MESNNARAKYIDIARGFVIILIVIGHSGPPKLLNKIIYGFHLPFFFILSGFLFNATKWQTVGIKGCIKAKAKSYLLPYVVLCLINWMLNIGYILFKKKTDIASRLLIGLLEIGYAGRFIRLEIATSLWFLPCLFVSSFFLHLLYKIKTRELRLCTTILAFALAICIRQLPEFAFTYGIPWHIDTALAGLFFMYLGTLIKQQEQIFRNQSIPCILTAAFIAVFTALSNEKPDMNIGIYGNPILLTVSSVLMFYVILSIAKRLARCSIARIFEYWGKHTIFFIGFSGIIHYTLGDLWKHSVFTAQYSEPWYVQALIVVLFMTLGSFLWDRLKNRFPRIAIF